MWHKTPASLFLPGWSKNTTATQHSIAIRQRKTCWLSCNKHTQSRLTWSPYKICEGSVSSDTCPVPHKARLLYVNDIVWCCLRVCHMLYLDYYSSLINYMRGIFSSFKAIHTYYNSSWELSAIFICSIVTSWHTPWS